MTAMTGDDGDAPSTAERIEAGDAATARLETTSDDELLGRLGDEQFSAGWGMSRTIDVDGRPVFVKTLPVTDVELDHLDSTVNVFDLPLVYQYGVGSAGFGAARELAAHRTVTRWVRDRRIEHFPLLFHHRLLPLPGQTRPRSPDQLDRYVEYWDGDTSIRRFVEARQEARWAIALFVEHVPHVLMDWLPLHQEAIGSVIDQATAVTDFLRSQGMAHFDANPSNVLTDGRRIYVADFGLFLDGAFDLSEAEQEFLARHQYFDVAEFIASLDWPVPGRPFEPGPAYVATLEPYRAVIDEMSAVFQRLTTGPKTSGGDDDARMAGLLAAID